MKLIYEPITEDYAEELAIKSELENLYRKLQALYENGEEPERIIQLDED